MRQVLLSLGTLGVLASLVTTAHGQETDVTQTPNAANAGIQKSYVDQIGVGRGDAFTPGSSAFILARDPFRAIARGRQLFQRKFTVAQGLGPRTNDGIGNIETDPSHGAGLADSCAACHGRPQGAAGFGGDVFTRTTSRDAPHLFGLGLVEMLADEITRDLRRIRDAAQAAAVATSSVVTSPLVSKGIGYGSIIAFPDGTFDTGLVEGVDADLRVRPFFAEGSTTSIREFLVGAFNAEMGLESADPDLLAASGGADVVTPSRMTLSGSTDFVEAPPAVSPTHDPDLDGVTDEIPQSVVDFMEFYLLNYFRPGTRFDLGPSGLVPVQPEGLETFRRIGCDSCHVPDLLIEEDRRLADTDTFLDYDRGNPFNNLFTVASVLFDEVDDGTGFPTLKVPREEPFLVENLFSDLKRHDLGPNFWERNFDGTIQKEFVTEPLWGVGSTSPYGHDGRSNTLEDVILRHGGEALAERDAFSRLGKGRKHQLLDFLRGLVLFSPPSTASVLDPIDESAPDYPLNGHGSIKLSVLFDDPSDSE